MPKQLVHSNAPLVQGNQVYLERPRIDRLLEKQLQNPVVIVNAGAGYGKTQAVYSFVRKYNASTIWMQFSERDNAGGRFWENFVSMIATANPKAAEKLAKIDFPETERQFERYLEIPLMELPPVGRCVFVYDDFHLVNNQAVLRFMERSITSPFPNITSILISRTEPAINLINLLSKGLLGRITEDDLRFSREEMTEYFRIQSITLPPQTLSSIYHDTEGWAFAIHLAGLSLKNAPPGAPYMPQAMRSNIFRLIESEIMSEISADLRKFLVKLSLVEHLAPDLLRDIAAVPRKSGESSGKKLIDEMEQAISFIRFDVYQNTYHIHHLLLEFLSGKQAEISEQEKREVYRQAAAWCACNNQKTDALNYYEKAGDYERLLDVVATMPSVLPNRTARMVLDIMDRAPPEIYDQIPHAHVQRIGMYLTLEMFDKGREELIQVITLLEGRPPSPTTYQTLAGCYNLLGFVGHTTSPYTRDYDYIRYFEKAQYYYDLNRFEVGPPMSVMPLSSYLCRVNSEEAGEIEKYIAAISAMIPHTSITFGGCALGMDDLCRGELAFYKGDVSGAEQFVLRALSNARQGKQYEIESRALFYLVRLKMARGDYPAIEKLLKQMEALLEVQYYPTRFTDYDILTGWYWAHTGQ
ncbi:MAG: helix-turn-helix transcriptional regulator, partial [Treponema sp.]|nr:helix-turn-helix transcriptional regulator [Treponema sp.]